MLKIVVREEVQGLGICVQGVMQLRSGRRDLDASKNRPLTPHFIVSVARGPGVQTVRSLSELCGLRVSVETYVAPKGPVQCKRCQRFGHTQSETAVMHPGALLAGRLTFQGSARRQSSSLNAAAAGATTRPTTRAAASGKRQK
jgi:hypothetical protein